MESTNANKLHLVCMQPRSLLAQGRPRKELSGAPERKEHPGRRNSTKDAGAASKQEARIKGRRRIAFPRGELEEGLPWPHVCRSSKVQESQRAMLRFFRPGAQSELKEELETSICFLSRNPPSEHKP